jgi:hypothetical protein
LSKKEAPVEKTEPKSMSDILKSRKYEQIRESSDIVKQTIQSKTLDSMAVEERKALSNFIERYNDIQKKERLV